MPAWIPEALRYVAFIHRDPGTSYGISFPDFPGCVSGGETIEEAIANGCHALTFHVSRLPEQDLPPPRSIDDIHKDPEIASWRDGAAFVFVPLLVETRESTRISFFMDRGLLAAIDDEADQRKISRTTFMTMAARRELQFS